MLKSTSRDQWTLLASCCFGTSCFSECVTHFNCVINQAVCRLKSIVSNWIMPFFFNRNDQHNSAKWCNYCIDFIISFNVQVWYILMAFFENRTAIETYTLQIIVTTSNVTRPQLSLIVFGPLNECYNLCFINWWWRTLTIELIAIFLFLFNFIDRQTMCAYRWSAVLWITITEQHRITDLDANCYSSRFS